MSNNEKISKRKSTRPINFEMATTKEWERRYTDFLAAIHQAGYPRFRDVTRMPKPTLEICFMQECRKLFGKPFDRVYYGPIANNLDFSQMLS